MRKRLSLSLQTTHHKAAFERADDQRGQFRAIDIRPQLASSLSLWSAFRPCQRAGRASNSNNTSARSPLFRLPRMHLVKKHPAHEKALQDGPEVGHRLFGF